jgi:Xaa-Pro aminopeptidase
MAGDWQVHRERLEAVRQAVRQAGLDGFVVPMTDAYQSEFIPEREKRIAWLVGFTGSAGTVVVLADGAALFVDGRYTLQAGMQVDTDAVAIKHSVEEPLADWLAGAVGQGARIGYDPWLHTQPWVEATDKKLKPEGASLVAVADNPVDTCWTDQPDPPAAPAVPHPLEFAGQPAADKIAAIVEGLAERKADAVVIGAPESVCWLVNMRGGDTANTPLALSRALVRRDGGVDLFIDPGKVTDTLADHLPDAVTVRPEADIGEALDGLGQDGATVELDPQAVNTWIVQRLDAAGATVRREQDPCALPKATKNAVELDGMRAAHRRDGVAVAKFLHWIDAHAGSGTVTELVAADRLRAFRAESNMMRDTSFDTISGSGPNGAIIHYRVTPESDRALAPGELYLVDSGGQYPDGTTDITRTVAIGEPSAEMRACFTQVLKGHIALSVQRFPKGTKGHQLDALARQYLWQAGLDYDHGTGHGVGAYLGVHEGPQRIAKLPGGTALAPGMVCSNEPGYYRPDAFGIRIENLIAVRECGALADAERDFYEFETLTLAPMDRRLIDVALLSPDEIAWVDAYHDRVWREIGPELPDDTRDWLRLATAPLAAD